MNNKEYERYQLGLIAIEYQARGYQVKIQTEVQGLGYMFDAVAEGPGDEQIFIEIVNKRQTYKAAQLRLRALEEVAAHAPNAKVDFRYLDVDKIAFHRASNSRRSAQSDLKQMLAIRVPSLSQGTVAGQFLNLWQLHASTIRALAAFLDIGEQAGLRILDLYNEMLRQKFIRPPEDIVEVVEMDLFEIFENVQSAIHGGVVDQYPFNQLRSHVLEVRKQIRQEI